MKYAAILPLLLVSGCAGMGITAYGDVSGPLYRSTPFLHRGELVEMQVMAGVGVAVDKPFGNGFSALLGVEHQSFPTIDDRGINRYYFQVRKRWALK
jgi:hypothetical protein